MGESMNVTAKFTTPSGDDMVIVPAAEYARLVEAAEMAEDVAALDEFERKRAGGEEELVPAAVVDRLLAGENPLRVWREHRGLSGEVLASRAGITQAYLSQIETGKRDGSIPTMKKVAEALGLTIDELI
jgi:DNA-binding XRE family transcriptional regulator